MRMILTARMATVIATFALATTACGSAPSDQPPGESSGESNTDATAPLVIATTSIWADITSEVLCGLDVPALIPVGADPHTFEPSLRDRELIERADLVIANGGGLEASLVDLLATTAAAGTNLVEVMSFVDVITDEAEDDEHDLDGDPHVWQDPNRVVSAVEAILSAARALGLDDCADDYTVDLFELDREIEDLFAPIPADRRAMVTSHDSLAYFAERYGLEVIGTVIPATNTLAQTNAADLAALADLIDERGVTAIFTERLESTADADALADRLDVAVIPLVTDALTDDPDSDTYVEMMRSNAIAISEALSP